MVGGIFAGSQLVIIHNFLGGGAATAISGELCAILTVEPTLNGTFSADARLAGYATVEGRLDGQLRVECEC